MLTAILSKLKWIRAESDLPLQLISPMQIALFATLLTLAFTSKDVGNVYEHGYVVTSGAIASVDSVPAVADTDESSVAMERASEAISRINNAVSSQIGIDSNEKKDDSSLLEVIEDKGTDDNISGSLTEKADLEELEAEDPSDSRIPKSRLSGKKAGCKGDNSFDEKRMKLINRMHCFIKENINHPLNKLVSNVMKTLSFFDEAKANETWMGFGEHRQEHVLSRIYGFAERLTTLRQHVYNEADRLSPTIFYAPRTGEPIKLFTTTSFDAIVKQCQDIIAKNYSDLGKMDILLFVEVLLNLIELDKLYDAVEVDIFSPLYEILKELKKDSCGHLFFSKRGTPLDEFCKLTIQDLTKDFEEVKALLTDDNLYKRGYLQINRFIQPQRSSSPNVPQARAVSRETQLISMDSKKLFAFQVTLSVIVVLMFFFQIFLFITKSG